LRTRGPLAAVVALLFVACGDDDSSSNSASAALSEDACQSPPLHGFGFDRYGGWKGIERAASGRFRVEQVDGVWWLITPEGHAMFSNGPTGVDTGDIARGTTRSPYLDAILARHGSLEAWASNTLQRFCDLGIRTLGGWMAAADLDRFEGKVPYSVNANFYTAMPAIRGGPPALVRRHDVFDARAEEIAAALASEDGLIARCAGDPWCIGVYTENEVPYLPSLLNGGGHLDVYLSLPFGTPAKVALQAFFAARYGGDVAEFNRVWGTQLVSFGDLQALTAIGSCAPVLGYEDDLCYFDEPPARLADRFAFEGHVAGRSAQLAAGVLEQANPDMLNLGPRVVISPFPAVLLQALAAPADVMSMNNYDVRDYIGRLLTAEQAAKLDELHLLGFDPIERVRRVGEITGKPVLITEWFYRRARPGMSSFPPFLPEVADGAAQAAAYREYMHGLVELPFVIGAHWFQWPDQPVEGRADGENQLIGIVDIDDNLNQPLADTVRQVNSELIDRRVRR
jgi:agarase